MRVLFTGASSFTGAWFVRALAEAGAEVTAACRGRVDGYDPMRRRRIAWIEGRCRRLVGGCAFGTAPFLDLIRRHGPFDLLCLHGAEVGDHRAAGYDPLAATAMNTLGLAAVLDRLEGAAGLLVTGSLFEADEGRGHEPRRAFSAYGLAKSLTWQVLRHEALRRGLPLGKFVVASPFGPLEKPCLAGSLVAAWREGRVAELRHPRLVRDHVQVQPLARAYAACALAVGRDRRSLHRSPSQFPERLDAFAARLAGELRARHPGLDCRLACTVPAAACDEPLARCGMEPLAALVPGLDEARAWDDYLNSP